jgi:uncharacterized membrane protein
LAQWVAGKCRGVRWTRERVGALIVGLGFGALLDGFVLHQLLQWHHLWSRRTPATTVEGLEDNTFADGVFHFTVLLVFFAGLTLVAVGPRLAPRVFAGLVLIGWGAFHVIDQFVFHLALHAHHIRDKVQNPEVYDWVFFGIGVVLIAGGVWVIRQASPRRASLARG